MDTTWAHRYTIDKKTGVCLKVRNSFNDMSSKQFYHWLEKNTDTSGMYKVGEQWHSESLDVVLQEVA